MAIRTRGLKGKEDKTTWKKKIKSLQEELEELQRLSLTGGAASRYVDTSVGDSKQVI